MSTTDKDTDGAVGFGGTVQERQRLDKQVPSATEHDRRENASFKGKSLLGVGILLGSAALIAAVWICSNYNVSHDHVLTSPINDGRLNTP